MDPVRSRPVTAMTGLRQAFAADDYLSGRLNHLSCSVLEPTKGRLPTVPPNIPRLRAAGKPNTLRQTDKGNRTRSTPSERAAPMGTAPRTNLKEGNSATAQDVYG